MVEDDLDYTYNHHLRRIFYCILWQCTCPETIISILLKDVSISTYKYDWNAPGRDFSLAQGFIEIRFALKRLWNHNTLVFTVFGRYIIEVKHLNPFFKFWESSRPPFSVFPPLTCLWLRAPLEVGLIKTGGPFRLFLALVLRINSNFESRQTLRS